MQGIQPGLFVHCPGGQQATCGAPLGYEAPLLLNIRVLQPGAVKSRGCHKQVRVSPVMSCQLPLPTWYQTPCQHCGFRFIASVAVLLPCRDQLHHHHHPHRRPHHWPCGRPPALCGGQAGGHPRDELHGLRPALPQVRMSCTWTLICICLQRSQRQTVVALVLLLPHSPTYPMYGSQST